MDNVFAAKKRIKDVQEQFKDLDLEKGEATSLADLIDARDKAAELFGPLVTPEAAFGVLKRVLCWEQTQAQEEAWADLNAAAGIAKTIFNADHVDPRIVFATFDAVFGDEE